MKVIVIHGGGAVHENADLLFRQRDEEDSIFSGVGVEDISEAGRDDYAEAVIGERPGGVLAGGAAAEVLSGDEDLGALVTRAVDFEIRILTPVVEEEFAVAVRSMRLRNCLGMI